MLGRMRKHHINTTYTSTYNSEEDNLIDWRLAFQDIFSKYSEQGIILRGYREKEGLTQKQLAKILDIEQSNISLMERGKRTIGKNLAKKFAKFFNTDYRVFL